MVSIVHGTRIRCVRHRHCTQVGQNIRLEVVGSMHSAPTTLHVFDHVKPLCKDWPGYPFPIMARRLDDLSSSHHPIGRNVFLGKREPLCSSVDGDQVLPVDEAVFVSKTIGASLTSHTPFRAPNSCPWKCTSRSSLSWLRADTGTSNLNWIIETVGQVRPPPFSRLCSSILNTLHCDAASHSGAHLMQGAKDTECLKGDLPRQELKLGHRGRRVSVTASILEGLRYTTLWHCSASHAEHQEC